MRGHRTIGEARAPRTASRPVMIVVVVALLHGALGAAAPSRADDPWDADDALFEFEEVPEPWVEVTVAHEGQVVSGSMISLERWDATQEPPGWAPPEGSTGIGDRDRMRMGPLTDGRHRIVVSPPSERDGELPAFTHEFDVEVAQGSRSLTLEFPAPTLRGQVRWPDGTPYPQARLSRVPVDDRLVASAAPWSLSMDAQGRFAVHLDDGHHALRVEPVHPDGHSRMLPTSLPSAVHPITVIDGRVVDLPAEAGSVPWVDLTFPQPTLNVHVLVDGEPGSSWPPRIYVPGDPDGPGLDGDIDPELYGAYDWLEYDGQRWDQHAVGALVHTGGWQRFAVHLPRDGDYLLAVKPPCVRTDLDEVLHPFTVRDGQASPDGIVIEMATGEVSADPVDPDEWDQTWGQGDDGGGTDGSDGTDGDEPADGDDPSAPDATPDDPGDDDAAGAVSFLDVVPGSTHASSIDWLVAQSITVGCAEGRFCPDEHVSRAQMATFLTRALDLAPSDGPSFADVAAGSTHEAAISALAASGITTGCAAGRFCPDEPVRRAHMAAFLSRGLGLTPPAQPRDYLDVCPGHRHHDAVQALAAAGITDGCAADRFCPEDPVTRAQMASFLARALSATDDPAG